MAEQPPLSRTFSTRTGAERPLTLADGFTVPLPAVMPRRRCSIRGQKVTVWRAPIVVVP
jgi:hypothetical protein